MPAEIAIAALLSFPGRNSRKPLYQRQKPLAVFFLGCTGEINEQEKEDQEEAFSRFKVCFLNPSLFLPIQGLLPKDSRPAPEILCFSSRNPSLLLRFEEDPCFAIGIRKKTRNRGCKKTPETQFADRYFNQNGESKQPNKYRLEAKMIVLASKRWIQIGPKIFCINLIKKILNTILNCNYPNLIKRILL